MKDEQPSAPDANPTQPQAPAARSPRWGRAIRERLSRARIVDCQLVPWGSNYSFAVALDDRDGARLVGIYKPSAGETPLWDFEAGGLYRREYASYLLSRVLGWSFIPPTVIRDGPHGVGTVQLYIEPAGRADTRTLRRRYDRELRQMMLFDLLSNNADRKAGHLFVGRDDRRLWGIDHGLTFHVHPKLRTVIWDYCGEPLEPEHLCRLDALLRRRRQVERLLAPLLDPREIEMVFRRALTLQREGRFPALNPRRNVPYGW